MSKVLSNVGNRHCSFRTILQVYVTLCAGGAFMIYSYYKYLHAPLFMNKNTHSQCIIPDIDPYDPSITKLYSSHLDPLQCDPTPSLTFVDESGLLRFNQSVYRRFLHNDSFCTYSIIELVDDYNIKFHPEVHFKSPVDVPSDSFAVRCREDSTGKIIYRNLHQKIDRRSVEKLRQFKNESDENFSVFIFGIDSVSRLAAIRKLPKTFNYLTNVLGGYVFNGFNKVGESSQPNIVGLLCGGLPEEYHTGSPYSDRFPFIFYDLEKAGYVTMFTEDRPHIASFSYHGEAGFKTKPTVHYSRAYWLAMAKEQLPFLVDQTLIFLESKAFHLRKSSSLCYGNRPHHVLIIDYVKQYLQAYKGKRKFFLSWMNELAHDYIDFLQYGDDDFMELLKWMHEENHLERAMLVFYSDHGSRVQEMRNSYTGRVEDRMPFLSLVVPEVLKKKYPQIVKNLEENQKRLTTPMDAHEAIRDIFENRYNRSSYFSSETGQNFDKPQSVSLFRKVPIKRSCVTAKIPDNYCACFSSNQVNTSQPIVKRLAEFVVQKINDMLLPVRRLCAIFKLDRILESSIVVNNLERNLDYKRSFTIWHLILTPKDPADTIYIINIRTVPANATFEATVRLSSNDVMEISGTISRTNRFGSQSKCIEDRILQNYCFCL